MDDLLRQDALDNVDIFFLTCDAWPIDWHLNEGGFLQLLGVASNRVDPRKISQACETIRRFVERGDALRVGLAVPGAQGSLPDRRAPMPLNEKILPDLMEAERNWLQAKAPTANVKSVDETLRKAGLSTALEAKFDRLIVAVENSKLVLGDLTERGAKPQLMVRQLLKETNLPASEEDVAAIARVLVAWEHAIVKSVRGRSPKVVAKSRHQIAQAQNRLDQLRRQIAQNGQGRGRQKVNADVVNPGLRELLGKARIKLDFNLDNWFPARFRGDDVTVLIRSEYVTMAGQQIEAPLLVKFPEGQGTVIFTSFHNEAPTSEQEEILLRYLVFTAMTAHEESRADKTMLSGGFSPAKRNQVNHMAGNASITRRYDNPGSGPLRFALIFTGARRLKLTLVTRRPEG